MNIIYEDKDIIVINKESGLAVQTAKSFQEDLHSKVANYLTANTNKKSSVGENRVKRNLPYVGIVHRLDQPVSGIVVFAKNEKAAAALSAQIQSGAMKKEYVALVSCQLEEGCQDEQSIIGGEWITLTDYLLKDPKTNLSKVVGKKTPGAKKAVLRFRTKEAIHPTNGSVMRVYVDLKTGRHHQIRAQLSHAGFPIINDRKYGGMAISSCTSETITLPALAIALCARSLEFEHPSTNKTMSFSIDEPF